MAWPVRILDLWAAQGGGRGRTLVRGGWLGGGCFFREALRRRRWSLVSVFPNRLRLGCLRSQGGARSGVSGPVPRTRVEADAWVGRMQGEGAFVACHGLTACLVLAQVRVVKEWEEAVSRLGMMVPSEPQQASARAFPGDSLSPLVPPRVGHSPA